MLSDIYNWFFWICCYSTSATEYPIPPSSKKFEEVVNHAAIAAEISSRDE